MPFTAFHVVPVWPLYVRWPRHFDVLALTMGAILPDLEIVAVYPMTRDWEWGRTVMHSFLGVVTVNLVLSLLAARLLIPAVAERLDRRHPGKGWRRFAGRDYVTDRRSLPVAAVSAVLGGATHLAIDLTHHLDTPVLWPWRDRALHLVPWADDPLWNLTVNAAFGVIFAGLVLRWVGK